MKKNIWLFRPIIFTLLGLYAAVTVTTLFFNVTVFYIEAAVLVVVCAYVFLRLRNAQKDVYLFLKNIGDTLSASQREAITRFPIPTLVVSDANEILWYNGLFSKNVLGSNDIFGQDVSVLMPNRDLEAEYNGKTGFDISYNGREYTVFVGVSADKYSKLYICYLFDNTDLKAKALKYKQTRPAVLHIVVDNYEETIQTCRESEKAQIVGSIESILENFILQTNGIMKKPDRDKFVAIIEEQHMQKIIEKKFEILDQVRQITVADKTPVTFSIGVGRGCEDMATADKMAAQALDMALGRGGDQAAVKTASGFEFYGGVSKGVEKRTKVRTRIVASALSELIESSDNVMVMGHKNGDLDSIGAAIGCARIAQHLGKSAWVVVNREQNLALPIIEKFEQAGQQDLFLDPARALEFLMRKTLLIVVDTHIRTMLDSEELYNQCKYVAVIDHHRKMVGHIDNAVIFYHEPHASSASEMVTELLQYISDEDKAIGALDAEALMAGITLDTKNFVLKTGVRTFEAAAYLRRMGADTVAVKQLFSSNMEAYQLKSKIISGAKVYKNCAVAYCSANNPDLRVIAPQAADELLSISNVDASFVLYKTPAGIQLSARSLGQVNVQVIMEQLGGGGHHTMAGAFIKDEGLEGATNKLLDAIDQYIA